MYRLQPSRIHLALVACTLGTVGVLFLISSQAATFVTPVEAEAGTVTSAASIIDDNSASNGKTVRFGVMNPGSNPLGGCTASGVAAPCTGNATTGASGWGMPLFSDDFGGTSLNRTLWSDSWFNGGEMNDVSTNPANVSVANGNLLLTLKSRSEGALANTNPSDGGKQGFQMRYGYMEARVFFPGEGATIYNWPAWWTDGQNWPTNGEIDIAEGLDYLSSNYHSSSGANNSNEVPGTWSNAFHIYGVNRQAGKNDVYWDGKLIRSYTTNDAGSPHYFILNVGAGSRTVLGAGSQVKVDYVRAWSR